ncbi:hypothetical protein [Rhodococcus sp. P1Y]|uniref:hypothetical protein n=1 Tax=Rhodococcus sp. P1Y TaxID=1302308 RepID=UPI001F437E8C|nr:hypothetical protein [Rhodococcus sp. P1Y]
MAQGLGSRRSNRIVMAAWALAAVGWTVWRVVDYARSPFVRVSVEPVSGTPPIELFGGVVREGDAVELSVAKTDVARLITYIDVFRYTEILGALVFLLLLITFLYRFCDRVIEGRAFGRGATVDVAAIAGSLVLFPFAGSMIRTMTTNSVVSSLELGDVVDTARSFSGPLFALLVAAGLQFVYATIQQGSKLARDAEGLV